MAIVPSPPKRVPLNLSSVPPADDEDPVAVELNEKCRLEQKQYSINGTLTPRKSERSMKEEQEQAYRHWRSLFQPSSYREPEPEPLEEPGGVARTPQQRGTNKRLLLALRRFFDELNETEELPSSRPGLLLLSLVAHEDNQTISWTPVTQTERNIRARVQRLDTDDAERRARAKQLLDEQAPKTSARDQFLKQTAQSRLDAKMGTDSDVAALERIEKAAASEEESKKASDQQRQLQGEQRKQAAREAYIARKNLRQEKLREILAMEENTFDEYEAVCRVRAQLEKEKGPAPTNNVSSPSGKPQSTTTSAVTTATQPPPPPPPAEDGDRELTPVDDPLEEL